LWELVEGRVVFVSPSGARHGRVVARVTRALSDFVEARQLGVVLAGDVGFVLRRHPDTVRAPDVAFLTSARLPESLPVEFMSGAPDLAVEVVSPGGSLECRRQKGRRVSCRGVCRGVGDRSR
jgi:Uma2 family endonuclease